MGAPVRVDSLNGKFIAFTSNQSGRNEIYVQAMPPGTWQKPVSINGGQSPRWKSDGKELFFVSPDAEMMAVDMTLDPVNSPGVPHRLFQLKNAALSGLANLANYDVRPAARVPAGAKARRIRLQPPPGEPLPSRLTRKASA